MNRLFLFLLSIFLLSSCTKDTDDYDIINIEYLNSVNTDYNYSNINSSEFFKLQSVNYFLNSLNTYATYKC